MKYVNKANNYFKHLKSFFGYFLPWRFNEEFVSTRVSVGKFTKKISNQGSQGGLKYMKYLKNYIFVSCVYFFLNQSKRTSTTGVFNPTIKCRIHKTRHEI